MHIELSEGGKVLFSAPQQRWGAGKDDENRGVLETANFAGQQMMAITDDAGSYELRYLGFKTCGYASMDEAKLAAPEFARRVIARMSDMIAD